jgi:ABC-type transport system substrate-binding protein
MRPAWPPAAALVMVLAWAGCSRSGVPSAQALGAPARVRALIVPQPQSLIPLEGDLYADGQFTEMIFSNLVKANYLGNLSPELAQSWEISPDHREYTFHLRRGVRFHNGQPLTVADVIFTLEQLIRRAKGRFPEVRTIEGYEDFLSRRSPRVRGLQPLDDHTLRVRLSENFKFFLPFLSAEYAAIVPRNYAGLGEAAFRQRPIGTGPYRLLRIETETIGRQEFIAFRLERFRDYFAATANVAAVDFYSANSAVAPADMNSFDILYISISEIPLFSSKADFRVINSSPNIVNFLILNPNENPQLRDRRVRQLIHHAIDREELVEKVFRRQAVPAHSMMPFGLLGHNPYYRIDYSRAATIRADLPPGKIRFTILTVDNDRRQTVAEFISRALARFNIEAQIITVTDRFDYFTNRIYHSGTSIMLGAIPDYPTSHHFLAQLVEPDGNYNVLRFRSPELLERIQRLPRVGTVDETRLLGEISRAIEDESLFVPLYYSANFFAVRSRVRNITINYGEVIDFAGLEVAE